MKQKSLPKLYPNSMLSAANSQRVESMYKAFLTVFLLFMSLTVRAEPWDDLADGILGALTGGLTRTIAIIACVGLGIAAMIGKLTWKLAGSLVGGIVLIFGSAAIVDFFIGTVE